jgi:hypothetical protein
MKIGREPQPQPQQGDLNFETPEETSQRLVSSIREARTTGRNFTEEEQSFINQQAEEDRLEIKHTYRS